ncbi:SDR family NAD(P)-dependent oxidoreductase [Hoyosella altamirensis]|uniref:NAD(P)-dependent dehydrogenase (Short-subunit alcohol dehydrogenase family) n=1 Tax=Hoyosella altamirensis TaxID=616997 RepID=A0A839RTA8_9ACTN|nr:SDR family oxidoreductase [Hoyosella altamirensis]MBB3039436.1 NAD(P)-dependent dehydrogenase (short-subunit alcohol dehydrogenase family) [Hoyosella altamirensis]
MTQRTALITGASRGIGAAIAQKLAEEGYRLTLSARREPGLRDTAERLRDQTGAEIHTVAANMAVEDDVRALLASHAAQFGQLDVLVLNAGVGTLGLVADLPTKMFDLAINVNLRAQFILIQEALPLLRKTAASAPDRGAKIIALASITGVASEAQLSAYGASKAALISLCETVTLEESVNGVTASAISPGYVDTDMAQWKHDAVAPSEMLAANDVAELAAAISRLSVNAVVPNIVVSRRGAQIWRA